MTAYERRQSRSFNNINRLPRISDVTITQDFTGLNQNFTGVAESSPTRFDRATARSQPSLLDQAMLEEIGGAGDMSYDEMEVEKQLLEMSVCVQPGSGAAAKMFGGPKSRDVFVDKENVLP
jgi:centromeric protein E